MIAGRSLTTEPSTGFAVLDRLLGRGVHPSVVERATDFLPGIFKSRTASTSTQARLLLRDSIASSGALDILERSEEWLRRRISELDNAASGIVARAQEAASAAVSTLAKGPNPKAEAAALDAQARLAVAEKTADALRDEVSTLKAEFCGSRERISALVAALNAVVKELRKSDFSYAVPLGLRAVALIENLEAGNRAALPLADEFFGGQVAEPLDLAMIPQTWIRRGTPTGFRWDEADLVFVG